MKEQGVSVEKRLPKGVNVDGLDKWFLMLARYALDPMMGKQAKQIMDPKNDGVW